MFLAYRAGDYYFNFLFKKTYLSGASRRPGTGTSQGEFSHAHGGGGWWI